MYVPVVLSVLFTSFNRIGKVECYNDNCQLPIFGHPCKGYDIEHLTHILLDPFVDDELICSTNPIFVHHNVAFLVDLSRLKDPNDVRADDMGSWKCTGSRAVSLNVEFKDEKWCIVSNATPATKSVRQYHVMKSLL